MKECVYIGNNNVSFSSIGLEVKVGQEVSLEDEDWETLIKYKQEHLFRLVSPESVGSDTPSIVELVVEKSEPIVEVDED